jgi:signal transduction histidine kinase
VTAFGKLIRTTAFRLTLVYLFLFALFAAFLLGYFAWNTRRMVTEQITGMLNAEVVEMNDELAQRGLRGLVYAIENRALRPGANLYLITTETGQALAGNIGSLAPGVMSQIGLSETMYRRLDERDNFEHRALVRVTEMEGGFRLLIGRDLDERRRIIGIVASAAQWSVLIVVVLGLAGGIFVARRVLHRIDAMTGTAQRIMAGDLSERLPVGRSGDEIDRLAENLNAMLERIEALMAGLKEVSDNIAHDLKTPLTRLRNHAEDALAKSRTDADYRAALEQTIEESDALIRTFNALLMIARAESGQARDDMVDFDAAEVARGIHDLYEPLAEDKGLRLGLDALPATVRGNRELISQALANLVENALKYGVPADGSGPIDAAAASRPPDLLIEARRAGDMVELSVTDHGPGIPEQDRQRAVERFVRLEASRTQPGSGLGLSLASAVATLHGGSLHLADAGPGLKATLVLPARQLPPDPSSGAASAAESAAAATAAGKNPQRRLDSVSSNAVLAG